MPIVITESDLGVVSVTITQAEAGAVPQVIVSAATKTDRAGYTGRVIPTEEVYNKLGVQAQTLVKSLLSSIRNRQKTQEGI